MPELEYLDLSGNLITNIRSLRKCNYAKLDYFIISIYILNRLPWYDSWDRCSDWNAQPWIKDNKSISAEFKEINEVVIKASHLSKYI